VRRFVRDEIRARNLTHYDLARRVGVSRPQLTNGLRGRFGFGSEVVAKLKTFINNGG
jgi:transcriptional regulator with XRE-family HTH domain